MRPLAVAPGLPWGAPDTIFRAMTTPAPSPAPDSSPSRIPPGSDPPAGSGAPPGPGAAAGTLDDLVARTEGLQPWRRVFHATNGIVLVSVLVALDPPWSWTVAALGALAGALFLADWLRFRVPALNRLFFRLFRPFASPREARGVASSTWYVTGCFLALALFPREVAIPAILVLALADAVASYTGRRWGRRPVGTGTVEGSLVFATVAFLVLFPFVGWGVGAFVAVVTAGVERIPWPLDDNLTIPLVAGALSWTLLPWWG